MCRQYLCLIRPITCAATLWLEASNACCGLHPSLLPGSGTVDAAWSSSARRVCEETVNRVSFILTCTPADMVAALLIHERSDLMSELFIYAEFESDFKFAVFFVQF